MGMLGRKMSKRNLIFKMNICLILAFCLGLASCGGTGTNNDQGTSFLAFGFFDDVNGETGVAQLGLPLAVNPLTQLLNGASTVVTFIGVENRLASQFLRVTQINCSYEIPGTTIPTMVDAATTSFVLGPALPVDEGEVQTTNGNVGYIGFQIFSTDLISYINSRNEALPQLPFRVIATCNVQAISQAGDVFTSNDLSITAVAFESTEAQGAA
jgi:hypothetical protein